MKNYFALVAQEFLAKSRQLYQFVPSHGPSIGSANEILIRDFLKQNLPKWFSVGHGFIALQDGSLSREIDVLVHRASMYAPLFSIDDFVVVTPDSAIYAIEVKTRINRRVFHDALQSLAKAKEIEPRISTSLFVYNAPSLRTICTYIESFDVLGTPIDSFPTIYGLGKYRLEFNPTILNKTHGVGVHAYNESKGSATVLERFFFDIYRRLEIAINDDLKAGIDNVIHARNNSIFTRGRLSYASKASDLELVSFVERPEKWLIHGVPADEYGGGDQADASN